MMALAKSAKRGCVFVSGNTGNGGNNGCSEGLRWRCHLQNGTGNGGNGAGGGCARRLQVKARESAPFI